MANQPSIVKQRDLTSIAKAMRAAGVNEWQLVCKPGGEKVIVAGKSSANTQNSDWD